MSEEEEKKLPRLEKRLVPNVDFDDQALNSLGVGTNIYYMLGAPWMGAILQRGVGKYPQGICLGTFDDHGTYP
jgi:hypothetical protein